MGPSLPVASRVGSDYCDGEGGGTRRCASGSIGLDIATSVLDKYVPRVKKIWSSKYLGLLILIKEGLLSRRHGNGWQP